MLCLAMTDYTHKNSRYPLYIFEWRKHLTNLKQASMADALGVQQSLYSGLESGARRANADQLIAIAEFLQIEPGQLFRSPDDPFNEVVSIYSKIPEADRPKVLGLLKAFAEKDPENT